MWIGTQKTLLEKEGLFHFSLEQKSFRYAKISGKWRLWGLIPQFLCNFGSAKEVVADTADH
jgi:hypothetical protein